MRHDPFNPGTGISLKLRPGSASWHRSCESRSQGGQRLAADHGFLVCADHAGRDPSPDRADHRRAGRVGGGVQRGPQPTEPRTNGGPDVGRMLADAASKDETVNKRRSSNLLRNQTNRLRVL